jgi:hypothetical protein
MPYALAIFSVEGKETPEKGSVPISRPEKNFCCVARIDNYPLLFQTISFTGSL